MKKYSSIRLQPGMFMDNLIASTNENFTLLENYTRLFYKTGVHTFSAESVAGFASAYQEAEIEHNLGEIPRFKLFTTKDDDLDPVTTLPGFPASVSIPLHWGQTYTNDGFNYTYFIGIDEEKIYIYRQLFNASGTTRNTPEDDIQYYIFDEVAK